MSDFKIEFTLKQHTPIIHFQSEQTGATIRASELKPKFDRFLIEHVFKKDKLKYEKFLINRNQNALNYKVTIYNTTNSVKRLDFKTYVNHKKSALNDREGSYFGKDKALKFLDDTVVRIIGFNSDLISLIKDYFEGFIAITNFGTRQNKGFGSFFVIKINNEPTNTTKEKFESLLLQYYPVTFHIQNESPLKKISNDYQLLKSGKNKPNYIKSHLFEYMCTKNVKWEKRMIKKFMEKDYPHIFKDLKWEKSPIKCTDETEDYDYQYIRGLLGIANEIEFLKTNPTNFKDKIVIQIKPTNENIERYKSPITFKVFENYIYVLANDDQNIKGEKFTFSIKGEEGLLNKAISIPANFDLLDFLNFSLVKKLNYKQSEVHK